MKTADAHNKDLTGRVEPRGYTPPPITIGRLVEALEDSYRLQREMWKFIESAVNRDVPDDSPQGKIFQAHEPTSTEIAWCFAEMALDNCEPCLRGLVGRETQSPVADIRKRVCAERERITKAVEKLRRYRDGEGMTEVDTRHAHTRLNEEWYVDFDEVLSIISREKP